MAFPGVNPANFDAVRERLRSARAVAVLTGAGISAESGIPTFRGPGGLWRKFRPEDLATPEAFARNPNLVWQWYDWRRGLIAQAQPNPAHFALVELERRVERFTLITQNVDGLHDRAGSKHLIKLHGDIWNLRCTRCRIEFADDRVPLPELPPRCACGHPLRPGVVWFGESLPDGAMAAAEKAADKAGVLLVIGTAAQVYPAAGLVPHARRAGACVVEINLDETPFSDEVDYVLRGKAGEILPQLL